MPRSTIARFPDEFSLERLDTLVNQAALPSRSQAIQEAVEEKLARLGRGQLTKDSEKLDLCASTGSTRMKNLNLVNDHSVRPEVLEGRREAFPQPAIAVPRTFGNVASWRRQSNYPV